MATTTETHDQIDSSELFEAALSDDPGTAQAQPEQVASADEGGQPRDDHGRFAAKAPEPEPQAAPEAAPQAQAQPGEQEHMLPSWRAREIAEERRAAITERDAARREAESFRAEMDQLRRQMQANQPKPEPVDIFADPNAWAQQQLSPFEQRLQSMQTNLTLRASRAENVAIHGRETVSAAEAAIGEAMNSGDPEVAGLRAKMLASDDPVGVAVEWHKSRSLYKETGGDLNAYRQRVLEEAMKDPAFQARVIEATRAGVNGGTTRTVTNIPPSLSRTASAAPASGSSDASDASIWAHATQ